MYRWRKSANDSCGELKGSLNYVCDHMAVPLVATLLPRSPPPLAMLQVPFTMIMMRSLNCAESEADRQLRQAVAQTPATPAQPVCALLRGAVPLTLPGRRLQLDDGRGDAAVCSCAFSFAIHMIAMETGSPQAEAEEAETAGNTAQSEPAKPSMDTSTDASSQPAQSAPAPAAAEEQVRHPRSCLMFLTIEGVQRAADVRPQLPAQHAQRPSGSRCQ